MLGYAGQAAAIPKILAAIPQTSDKQELQLHYLYALRMFKQGWTANDKTQLAEVLGRASKWRGGAQFINFVGQFFDSVADLYASDAEKQLLYEKAPDFSPLTPTELADIQARQAAAAAAGRGGRGGGGGRGGTAAPLAARTAGRVLSRQEMFEETVYQPQQVLDADAGRKAFEANCASCHKFGSVGTDHGSAELESLGFTAARVQGGAPRGGILPRSEARAGTRNDRDRNNGREEDQRARAERGRCDGLDSDVRRHGDRSPKGADQVAHEDQNVDHAGLAGRHDRPEHHAQPGGIPGGVAAGGCGQRRAVEHADDSTATNVNREGTKAAKITKEIPWILLRDLRELRAFVMTRRVVALQSK